MAIPPCYVEFRVYDENRFKIFQRFVNGLKTHAMQLSVTASHDEVTHKARPYEKPEDWMLIFRPQDLQLLGMPGHLEAVAALRAWEGITRSERRTIIKKDEALQQLADFADMVKRLTNTRYQVISCEKIAPDVARLEFTTDEPIFTERDAVESLLLFFGFFNLIDEAC